MKVPSALSAQEWLQVDELRSRGLTWYQVGREVGVNGKSLQSAYRVRQGKPRHKIKPHSERTEQMHVAVSRSLYRRTEKPPETPGAKRTRETVAKMRAEGASEQQIDRALGKIPTALPSGDPYGLDPRRL